MKNRHRGSGSSRELIQITGKLPGSPGMAQLVEGAFLDLPDALTGKLQISADLGKGLRVPIREAEPSFDDETLFGIELLKELIELLFKRLPNQGLIQRSKALIGKHVFQLQIRIA